MHVYMHIYVGMYIYWSSQFIRPYSVSRIMKLVYLPDATTDAQTGRWTGQWSSKVEVTTHLPTAVNNTDMKFIKYIF